MPVYPVGDFGPKKKKKKETNAINYSINYLTHRTPQAPCGDSVTHEDPGSFDTSTLIFEGLTESPLGGEMAAGRQISHLTAQRPQQEHFSPLSCPLLMSEASPEPSGRPPVGLIAQSRSRDSLSTSGQQRRTQCSEQLTQIVSTLRSWALKFPGSAHKEEAEPVGAPQGLAQPGQPGSPGEAGRPWTRDQGQSLGPRAGETIAPTARRQDGAPGEAGRGGQGTPLPQPGETGI